MTLDLYFARRFLKAFGLVFGAFLGFLVLLEIVDQIRRFDTSEIGLPEALELALLAAPETLYRILPLIVLLSTLVLCLGLARSSELVIARAAGRSGLMSLAGPVVTVALLGAVAVAAFNPIVAATSLRYDERAARFAGAEASVLSVSDEGLWMRQGGAEGQTVIRAGRASRDGSRLYGLTFIEFDASGVPLRRIEAAEARLVPGAWELAGAKVWPLAGAGNPEAESVTHETLRLPSDLTIERIRDSFATPSAVPIWKLQAFISQLEAAGFSARQHRVWLQMELALPAFLVAMSLIGAGFTMRHARFGKTGQMVVLAIALGFGLYFLRNLAQVLGENGQIPPLFAAWSPPLAGILASLGLLLHLEDG
ncbi:MAG: LPS export ABC transporter permease LptG [Rhodobacteraceae bacterium]|nr:LPS export ABC transporter permease LptG [Paracoccaceae bacterium]